MYGKQNAAQCIDGVQWFHTTGRNIIAGAFPGGQDVSGEPIFVGRAKHLGELIPGMVVLSHKMCYVTHSGQVYGYDRYEIMVARRPLNWVFASNGLLPVGAVPAGYTSSNETLFVGRCFHQGSLVIGKVHPSHRCCYISHGGREYMYQQYEILVTPPHMPPQPLYPPIYNAYGAPQPYSSNYK